MCRLFGYLGVRGASVAPWILETSTCLRAQANARPEQLQSDGWGVAWIDEHRKARLARGIHGAYEPEEAEHFSAAARAARGPLVLAHLRKASNPMNLPHERLIALENTQPFTYNGYLFAHNGSIPLPAETRPHLDRFEKQVRGVNDSEVLFWLLVKHVEAVGDPLTAYRRARDELVAVWNSAPPPRPTFPYTGLNVLFSRGANELWAFASSLGEHGTGLLDLHRPYYEMAYRADAKELLVASEPLENGTEGWKSLPTGTYLSARVDHGLLSLETGSL
jgi:predicted glutamine amidotransferase